MYTVDTSFHAACQEMSPQTRARVYFFDESVDYTDDSDVTTNGTLLVLNEDDTDSNGRIDLNSGGIKFTEYFNTAEDIEIGRTASNTINMALVNSDGALNSFEFGLCKVYLDLYVSDAWITVPFGVFNIEIPTRRKKSTISATGYDLMQKLEDDADAWWSSITWDDGVTQYQILVSMASYLGLTVSSTSYGSMVNADYSYTEAPFSAQDMTYKEVLSWLAEANCCNARFDRDGYLDLRFYSEVSYGYSEEDGFFTLDQGEYSTPMTLGVQVKVTETDIGVTVGTSNTYIISNNGFLYGDSEDDITDRANAILTGFSDAPSYSPIAFTAQGDWSIECGDVIPVVIDSTTLSIPVMQQKFTWLGGYVKAEVTCTGSSGRSTVQSYSIRKEISNLRKIHEIEVDLDTLRSTISDNSGNITEILQTIDSISTTVATATEALTSVQDSISQLWTWTQTSHVTDNGTTVDLSKYIRFEDGSIVLGVSDSDMKLRIENDQIVFFTGDDFDENATIYAQFTPSELLDAIIKATSSIYVGNDSSTSNFKQTKTTYNSVGEYTLSRA